MLGGLACSLTYRRFSTGLEMEPQHARFELRLSNDLRPCWLASRLPLGRDENVGLSIRLDT